MFAVDIGAGDRTVVGVSGAFGTWEIWQPPFEALSRRARVIAYDHFGTGLTDVPPERVTFDEHAATLLALLDALAVERCVIAADSGMVAVAVEAALRAPDRVEGLALVAGGVAHSPSPTVSAFVEALRTDFDAALDLFVGLCLPDDETGEAARWLRAIIRRTGGERAAALVEALVGVDLSDRLPEVAVPAPWSGAKPTTSRGAGRRRWRRWRPRSPTPSSSCSQARATSRR